MGYSAVFESTLLAPFSRTHAGPCCGDITPCSFATVEGPATISANFLEQRAQGLACMNIMAFGDIHEYLHPLAALAAPLRQADLILVTGDMTRWRGPETATKVLQAIRHYNPHVLAQVGNTDSWDIQRYLTQVGINLHGQGHRFGEVGIFGVGGSTYTA